MKVKTALQTLLFILMGATVAMSVAAAVLSGKPMALSLAVVSALVFSIPILILRYQLNRLKQAGARIRANLEAIAKECFDSPANVRDGYDLSVTMPEGPAALVSSVDTQIGFTADGTFGGARVSIASHESVAGRQVGEMSHTYSHVVVDLLGLQTTFSLKREGLGSRLKRAIGASSDVQTGDQAFDETFVVTADDALARYVLGDESVRARLLHLQSQVSTVSSDVGTGGMSIFASKHGLALRWPGDISPKLAKLARDLLLDMRARSLRHEEQKAVAQGQGTYRVATGLDEAPPVEEPSREELNEPRGAAARMSR